ncbi:hypothetical protein Tco_0332161 [Tanacetum coccineum]
MNSVAAQQVALDNALVAPEKQLKIKKCNMRIEFNEPQREPTFQVTLDVLKLSPCNPAFLYFMRSSRSVPNSLTKILLNLPPMKKWFHLLRISGTLASVICSLRSLHIKCTCPGEHLLLSSIGASLGSPQTLILDEEPIKKPKRAKHPEPAKKSAHAKKDVSSKKLSRK